MSDELADKIDALPADAQAEVAQMVARLSKRPERREEPPPLSSEELGEAYDALPDDDRRRVSRMVRKAAGRRASPKDPG